MHTLIHQTRHLQNYKLQLCLPKYNIFKCTPLRLIANLVAYQNPGIAAATSTRLDSAAKHIMACKVDSDLMMDFVSKNIQGPSDKRREMHINKHKYCVFKNDLVLCTNKPLFPSDNNKSGHRPAPKIPCRQSGRWPTLCRARSLELKSRADSK